MPGDEWQSKLDTYLDGELPAEEMRELDSHVRSCPSCTAEMLNRLQLKRAVQASAAKRYLPTAEFRERIQKSITIRRRPAFRWGWLTAATVAALLIAGALTFYVGLQKLHREQVFSELADLHRSEEHTSELQSPDHLVCRLLLEKKKKETDLPASRATHSAQLPPC